MEPYGQFCPIVRAAEVLGDRWTPLIRRINRHLLPIIQVDGIPTLARAFPRWLPLSHFVDAVSTMVQGRPQTPRTRTA